MDARPQAEPSTVRLSLISALATLAVPGGASLLVPFWILTATGTPLYPKIGLLHLLALLLAAVGAYFIIWVSVEFVRRGRGTPLPLEPPTRLVAGGLYQYVRNPMYVGAVALVLAEALYFRSGWLALYAGALWATLHTALVGWEEPQLRRRFGAAYEDYLRSVPRWVPRRGGNHEWPLKKSGTNFSRIFHS